MFEQHLAKPPSSKCQMSCFMKIAMSQMCSIGIFVNLKLAGLHLKGGLFDHRVW